MNGGNDTFSIDTFTNLADVLTSLAERMPDRTALTFLRDGESDTETATYAGLYRRAIRIAHTLTERKARNERVLVFHPPGIEFLAAMFGCWMAGAIPIPTYPPTLGRRGGSRFAHIIRDARPAFALSTSLAMRKLIVHFAAELGLKGPFWIATDSLPEVAEKEFIATPSQLALLQYTSGSTGDPRGVILTHANLLSNLDALHHILPQQNRRVVSWLPPYHDMGLIGGILTPITYGGELIQMDPLRFFERPVRWLRAISAYHAAVGLGADFAYNLCVRTIGEEDRADLDLSSWAVAFNGAEPVRPETLDAFSRTFAPCGFRSEAFVPCYGLAEATLIVTGKLAGQPNRVLDGITSCGQPVAQTRVVIRGDNGLHLPDGEIGEILVAGPGVCSGYWNRPSESINLFEGQYLRTGDLGRLDRGELFVTGRIKDLIIVRGRNYYPSDVEAAAEAAHAAIAPHASAAFPTDGDGQEAIAVICELNRAARRTDNLQDIARDVVRGIAAEIGVSPHLVALVRPGAVPRTTSGKIRRSAARQLFHSGQLAVLATSRQHEHPEATTSPRPATLADRVRGIVRSVCPFPLAPHNDDKALEELGLDSLLRAELLIALEYELDIRLENETVSAHTTLAELTASIARQSQPNAHRQSAPDFLPIPGLEIPLTPIQSQYLAGRHRAGELSTVIMFLVPPLVQPSLLRRACLLLEEEFDALRLRFVRDPSGWRQYYAQPGNGVSFEHVESLSQDPGKLTELRRKIDQIAQTLDVEAGPLVQLILFTQGTLDRAILVLCMHHLVADGASSALIARALDRNYRKLIANLDPKIELARPCFGEWCLALARNAQSEQTRAELPEWCRISPQPSSQAPVTSAIGSVPEHFLTHSQQRALESIAPLASSRQAICLAALWSAWSQATGESSLVILLEDHGRTALPDCLPFRTAGWFVHEYPVRFDGPDQPFPAADREIRVRNAIRAVPRNGVGFGMLRELTDDAELRASARSLALPRIHVRFPRHRYTADLTTTLKVIRRYSLFPPEETIQTPPLTILFQPKNGLTAWTVTYLHDGLADHARSLAEGIERYFTRRLDF